MCLKQVGGQLPNGYALFCEILRDFVQHKLWWFNPPWLVFAEIVIPNSLIAISRQYIAFGG